MGLEPIAPAAVVSMVESVYSSVSQSGPVLF